jgi:hypothetical protein
MDENTRNFLDFWNNYTWPETKPVFFRLYYDDAGYPICYSMEDLPGCYLEITAEQYAESNHRVRVQNGKIIKQQHATTSKLVPSLIGTACCPEDVTIVTHAEHNQKWKLKNYDHS